MVVAILFGLLVRGVLGEECLNHLSEVVESAMVESGTSSRPRLSD